MVNWPSEVNYALMLTAHALHYLCTSMFHSNYASHPTPKTPICRRPLLEQIHRRENLTPYKKPPAKHKKKSHNITKICESMMNMHLSLSRVADSWTVPCRRSIGKEPWSYYVLGISVSEICPLMRDGFWSYFEEGNDSAVENDLDS
jgi:hypothetical protein